MSDVGERTSGARPRWLLPAGAALVVLLVIVAIIALTGGGDDDPSGEGDGTTEPAPPSEVELELVDVDLADAAAPSAALEAGDLTVALVPGTTRPTGDLVALDDDRDALAAEPILPLVHLDVALPELDGLLQPVSAALTTEELARLTEASAAAPDVRPEDVLTPWLQGNELAAPTPIDAPGPMRIQTLDTPDLRLAAYAYGEVLLAAGFVVEYLTPVPAASDLVAAIRDRGADMVLGGGSSLLLALGQPADDLPPVDEIRSTATNLAGEVSGTALTPAAADRGLRALTSATTADELDLETLSDLGPVTGRRQVGVLPGCDDDPLCRARLEDGYGLRFAR